MSVSEVTSTTVSLQTPLLPTTASEALFKIPDESQHLVFVDAAVSHLPQLLEGIKASKVVVLDSTRDGVEQIAEVLANHHDLAGVHIFSHGDSGSLKLGNAFLSQATLDRYTAQLQQWGNALSQQGDLLFYGCNAAQGSDGLLFVQQIGQITGADIAASSDLTGSSLLEGDWELEVAIGAIESEPPLLAETIATYEATLAPTLGANLVTNGSFENPIFPTTTVWQFFSAIPGWQVSAGQNVELQHGHHSLGGTAASDGITWNELDTDRNSGIRQLITTETGKPYQISFAYSPEPGSPASTTGIEVYWNGQRLDAIALDGTTNTTNSWTTYTYEVIGAAGSSTALEFRAAGTSDGTGGYLDNVQVREVLDGTPPPADTLAPTATLGAAANVTTAGSSAYTFTVNYSDDVAVNVASIDNSDILVTGPNGFSQLATRISVNDTANGTPRTATYSIPLPGGSWDTTDNGTYTLALQAAQVSDTSGKAVPTATLGSFQVNIPVSPPADALAPTATLGTATNVTTAGSSAYTFTVNYSDDVAVNVASIDNSDILVTGPNGFSQLATRISVNDTANGTPRTATYSIPLPGGSWDTADNGTYTLALQASQVSDTSGKTVPLTSLGSFQVNIPVSPPADAQAPTATLGTATNVTTAGSSAYTFTVNYSDDVAVNVASIDNSDILVTGPNGFSQLATRVSVNNTANGTPRTATYSIPLPGGSWDTADNGTYTLALQASQVSDTSGKTAPLTSLGSFQVNIPATPPPPSGNLGANLVGNGSFENPVFPTSTVWQFFGSIPSWQSLGTNFELQHGHQSLGSTAASDGVTWAELDTDRNSGIRQQVPTEAGKPYQISFAYSPEPGSAANTTGIAVYWNGQLLDTIALDGTTNTTNSWTTYTYQVIGAVGTSTGLEFRATGNSDGTGGYLDNVQVREVLDGAPPPADTLAPTATLGAAANVTTADSSAYTFTVNYSDDVAVNVASIDNSDILVTGPNGFSQLATRVSVNNTANGTPRTATYSIPLPGGSWDTVDNGTYTLTLQAAQVSDTSGKAVPTATLGSFQVNIPTAPPADALAPTATLGAAANVTTAGSSAYTFTVNYSDDVAVNVASIDNSDILVTGPNGFSQLATRVSVNNTANGTPRTVTYSIPLPGGSWDTADNGTYTLALQAAQVSDTSGKTVPLTSLGSFQVNIPTAPPPPSGNLGANLVGNGSFENPVFPTSTVWQFFGSIPSWQSLGTNFELQHGHQSLGSTAASDGVTWAELDTDRNSGIRQQVPTEAGKPYQISFAYSPEPGSAANTTGIAVYWNGQLLDTIALDGTTNTTNVWTTYTYQVIGAAGSSTGLEFRATGNSDGTGGYLDNVQVREVLDGTPVSYVGLGQTSATVSEAVGNATISLVRTGDTTTTVIAAYEATDGTPPGAAVLGSDYSGATGTVTFLPGETTKLIQIPIINDTVQEGNEIFNVALGTVTGGLAGTPRTAQITIVDNDGTASVAFDRALWSVDENAGTATITVQRSGNTSVAASVDYSTSNGTATAGSDYTATSGTLNFAVGETSKSFTIPIFNDTQIEPGETVAIALSQPSGATIGTQATATLTILDNDNAIGNLTRQTVASGLSLPTAIDFSPDGSLMFVAQKNGVVRVVKDGVMQSQPFVDISSRVNESGDRGLLSIAVHPEFNTGKPLVYLLYTYDPPEVNGFPGTSVNGRDRSGNRPSRLEVFTADASTGFMRAVSSTGDVILGKNSLWQYTTQADSTGQINLPPSGIHNGTTIVAPSSLIEDPDSGNLGRDYRSADTNLTNNNNIRDYLATDSTAHSIAHVAFGPDGALYVTVGDGTSYNFDDRTVRVQDIDNLNGKMLRIDPLTGLGLSDNPFWNGDADSNRSKVLNYGLRNTFRFSFAPNGIPLMGDVGWNNWEEINMGKGANFGWPYFEGGNGTNLRTNQYQNLSQAQAFYTSGQAVTAPIYARSHADGARSMLVSDFYDDLTAFAIDTVEGSIRVLTFDSSYNLVSTKLLANNINYLVQVKKGPDGRLYDVELDAGTVSRWTLT